MTCVEGQFSGHQRRRHQLAQLRKNCLPFLCVSKRFHSISCNSAVSEQSRVSIDRNLQPRSQAKNYRIAPHQFRLAPALLAFHLQGSISEFQRLWIRQAIHSTSLSYSICPIALYHCISFFNLIVPRLRASCNSFPRHSL